MSNIGLKYGQFLKLCLMLYFILKLFANLKLGVFLKFVLHIKKWVWNNFIY